MNRRFVLVTLLLTATAAFLVGLIVAGSLTPSTAQSAGGRNAPLRAAARPPILPAGGVNFADIAERINPAVVNIDATSRGRLQLPGGHPFPPDLLGPGGSGRSDGDVPRKGAGSGVIIAGDGYVLTNHHVIDR
jgi:serine protease Do